MGERVYRTYRLELFQQEPDVWHPVTTYDDLADAEDHMAALRHPARIVRVIQNEHPTATNTSVIRQSEAAKALPRSLAWG
jgi:hypothetical protein